MRKHIGWQEIIDGVKWELRVLFPGGGRLRWRRVHRGLEFWEDFEPTPDQWRTLVEKTRARYQRRQVPWKEVQLVERCAAAAGVRVAGGPGGGGSGDGGEDA